MNFYPSLIILSLGILLTFGVRPLGIFLLLLGLLRFSLAFILGV